MQGPVESLWRYPVKGLSPERLDRVVLEPGRGFPFDRAFGFARASSGFDQAAPKPMPKTRFHMLAREGQLAALRTGFDPETSTLTLRRPDGAAVEADVSTPEGRTQAAEFIAAYLGLGPGETPLFASASPHRFTDVSVASPTMMNAVSILNLASVADLAFRTGFALDPLRFRANIHVDGLPPFAEFDLVGREIAIGDVRLRILDRIDRCAATEVDPASGRRDVPVVELLHRHYRHVDMGVYAEVVGGGTLSTGNVFRSG